MKILLIKQTSLGDVLHITPVIRAIKKWNKDAIIDVVIDKRALGILENNPYVNRLYVLDIYGYERNIFKSPKSFLNVVKDFFSHIREVRKTKYDIAIDLQGLERSIVFLYLSKSKKKYAKGRWPFVKHKYYKDINAIKGYMSFLDFFNCPDDGTDLDYFLSKDTKKSFFNTLEKNNINLEDKYIVISPFSRWITKDLSVEKTKEIISNIKNIKNIQIVITGTEDYKEECQNIAIGFDNVLNMSSIFNLSSLAYLIKNACGMITVDSFPMHTASAFNIPMIALFGPTSEKRVGPLSYNSTVIRLENLSCARCYRRKDCPNNHICIEDLDSSLIAQKIIEKIDKRL